MLKWLKRIAILFVLVIALSVFASRFQTKDSSTDISPTPEASLAPQDPAACNVAKLEKAPVEGIKVYSPKGDSYAVNKEDSNGVAQIYTGKTGSSELTCITCAQNGDGPKAER